MSQIKAILDKLLTNVSQGYVPVGFVADALLTPLSTKQSSGKIGKYGLEHLRILNTLMGGRGGARRIEIRQVSSDGYFVEPHGLEDIITEEEYDNYEDPFDIEKDVTLQLTTVLKLGKEKALADSLRSTSVLTQNDTLSGTDQWDDYTNSDPIAVINDARATIRNASGAIVDTMTLDENVVNVLRYHPKILRNLGYADARAGQLSNQDLARAFNLKRILVAEAMYNSAKEGQADSLAPVWGKDVILSVSPTSPMKVQKSLGYNVYRKGKDVQVFKTPIVNPPGAKSVIAKQSYDQVITDVKCGYLVKAAIS